MINQKKLVLLAKEMGWTVEPSEDGWTFQRFSPKGHDFIVETGPDIIGDIRSRVQYFDVSSEAYLWLDDTGHGTNGAPYDMRDVYEDFEASFENLEKLYLSMVLLEKKENERGDK